MDQRMKEFNENYKYPVYVHGMGFMSILQHAGKNYFSLKNKYIFTSMRHVDYNKWFLHLTTGVSGSMHDAYFLQQAPLGDSDLALLLTMSDLYNRFWKKTFFRKTCSFNFS